MSRESDSSDYSDEFGPNPYITRRRETPTERLQHQVDSLTRLLQRTTTALVRERERAQDLEDVLRLERDRADFNERIAEQNQARENQWYQRYRELSQRYDRMYDEAYGIVEPRRFALVNGEGMRSLIVPTTAFPVPIGGSDPL